MTDKEQELNAAWEKEWMRMVGVHRGVAIKILDCFEDLLDKHSIYIPDDDRTGDESEACLYGEAYHELENEITAILEEYLPLKEGE